MPGEEDRIIDSTAQVASVAVLEKNWDMQVSLSDDASAEEDEGEEDDEAARLVSCQLPVPVAARDVRCAESDDDVERDVSAPLRLCDASSNNAVVKQPQDDPSNSQHQEDEEEPLTDQERYDDDDNDEDETLEPSTNFLDSQADTDDLVLSNVNASANTKPALTVSSLEAHEVLKFYEILD